MEPPWLACFQADNRNRRSRALNAEKALSNGEGKRWKARSGRKRKKRRSKTAPLVAGGFIGGTFTPRSSKGDIQERSKRRLFRRCLFSAGREALSRLRLISALNGGAQRRSGDGINAAWKAQGMEPAILDPFPGLYRRHDRRSGDQGNGGGPPPPPSPWQRGSPLDKTGL